MRIHLSAGYIIKNKENRTYSITKKMGEGATCIAYYGVDEQTKAKCVIKEYYPINVSIERTDDGWIVCAVAEIDKFNRGKERFNSSIERQINLRNIGNATNQIFYVLDCFEANGTSYVVVPQYSGSIYSENSEIDLYNRIKICKSVAEYIKNCHAEGYLCLDIKPDNIFVIPETSELAMFFDFDSVYRMDEVMCGENLSYTSSWAAPEQIVPGSYTKISKASDIFVLGELLYKANYEVCIGLARAYLYNGDIEKSKIITDCLYLDLKEVDRDNRGTYFAEMYYNIACRYLVQENMEQAEIYFLHAIEQFKTRSIYGYGNRGEVGIARCQYQLGNMLWGQRMEDAKNYYCKALEIFKACLGNEHIETIRCKEMIGRCKKS